MNNFFPLRKTLIGLANNLVHSLFIEFLFKGRCREMRPGLDKTSVLRELTVQGENRHTSGHLDPSVISVVEHELLLSRLLGPRGGSQQSLTEQVISESWYEGQGG